LLSPQRHKQFIQQLRLMNVKRLMNEEISWFRISARNFALSPIELFYPKKKFNLTGYFNGQEVLISIEFDSVIQWFLHDWGGVSDD
jgi:hypothetical protein